VVPNVDDEYEVDMELYDSLEMEVLVPRLDDDDDIVWVVLDCGEDVDKEDELADGGIIIGWEGWGGEEEDEEEEEEDEGEEEEEEEGTAVDAVGPGESEEGSRADVDVGRCVMEVDDRESAK
jgi:hypothetical protein